MSTPRCCGTCVHHVPGIDRCTGQCTNPIRQLQSDVAVLVRSAELACRADWGADFWEAREPDPDVRLKVWGPYPPHGPAPDAMPSDLLAFLMGHASDT